MRFRINEIQLPAWGSQRGGQPSTKRAPEKQSQVLSGQNVMTRETIHSHVQLEFSAPAHQSTLTDRKIRKQTTNVTPES